MTGKLGFEDFKNMWGDLKTCMVRKCISVFMIMYSFLLGAIRQKFLMHVCTLKLTISIVQF